MRNITELIAAQQVVIISGETGCGKSTQVPQYIYRSCRQRGERCRVICTQPRRLAAINLARRVASEMDCKVGSTVGYQVGMNPVFHEDTSILFVTTGIFLQRLIHEQSLKHYTHVVLDEIHERDLNSDFSMVAAKYILKTEPQAKIILMSATFDTQLFSLYFAPDSIKNIESTVYLGEEKGDPGEPNPVADSWGEAVAEEEKASVPAAQWAAEVPRDNTAEMRHRDIDRISRGERLAPVVCINEHKFDIKFHYFEDLQKVLPRSDPAIQSVFGLG